MIVLGKGLANGYPLAAVVGRRDIMDGVHETWISSTLATESVSLSAAKAVIEEYRTRDVCGHLHEVGGRLIGGLQGLAEEFSAVVTGVQGIPEMCFLTFHSHETSGRFAAACARRGVLFKRSAYNFVSLAHDVSTIDRTVDTLREALAAC